MNDLTNKNFGYWVALYPVPQGSGKPIKWLCRCTLCGEEHLVAGTSLVYGSSTKCKKCGLASSARKREIFHDKRLRFIFKGIRQRCYDPNSISYKNYGAKGITVCDEWLSNPSSFEQWALANGYEDGLSIDRIDNLVGYSPSNCRWVTKTVQNRNRSSVYLATIDGRTMTVTEWCHELGLLPSTIHTRIRKGMSPEDALLTPIQKSKSRK